MKKRVSVIFFLLVAAASMAAPGRAQSLHERSNEALRFALHQLDQTSLALGDSIRFPRSTRPNGAWQTSDAAWWASGFYPGLLWYAYGYTGDPRWRARAERLTEGLAEEASTPRDHDIGFRIFCSYGNGYRFTGDPAYRDVILRAAKTLATRYNPTVKAIESWNSKDKSTYLVIIDNMMNLEMMFWAARNGGDASLRKIAIAHANTSMKAHVRRDGSTYHVAEFDPRTGALKRGRTAQGYADESTWSRGQAWAIYGFTVAYRETKDPRYLETAERTAGYFISQLPADFVPAWDFRTPDPYPPKDASAGAVAASALLELATLTPEPGKRMLYHETAEHILRSLSEAPAYLAAGSKSKGILQHSVGHLKANSEVDVSIVYGDYYFVEALLRRNGLLSFAVPDAPAK